MWLVRVLRLRPLLRPGRAVLCERSRSAGLRSSSGGPAHAARFSSARRRWSTCAGDRFRVQVKWRVMTGASAPVGSGAEASAWNDLGLQAWLCSRLLASCRRVLLLRPPLLLLLGAVSPAPQDKSPINHGARITSVSCCHRDVLEHLLGLAQCLGIQANLGH